MKIAFFLTQYMKLGGVENVVRELAKRMKKNHQVYLIVRKRPQNTEFEDFWDDVLVIPDSTSFRGFLKSKHLVETYIKNKKIDVVNFHNTSTIIPFVFSNFKKVLTMHGTMTENMVTQRKWHMVPLFWLLEEFVMNSCDQLISISKYHMKAFTLRNLNILPNGVDTTFFSPKKTNRTRLRKKLKLTKKTGLFVGKFMPIKGLNYLISAAKKSKSDLLIIGSGEEEYLLKNLPKNIKYIGPVYDKKKLREYYAAVDYLVIPSINEGLPLVLLEALAMKLPIIGTRVGGIPETIEGKNGCVLINSKNSNDLQLAMDKLTYELTNIHVNSWDAVSNQTLKVFKKSF
ncbi:MAG: glycosyltransferase family 4 protein [Candidatus Altiarchaeota archaeon]|nr:glycosyltransferase family 4 protein [Candidatus Altiarchaeota archaeon]